MAKFKLTALCTISVITDVEAETLEEAIEIANSRKDVMHQQFENPDINEHWCAGGYDGMPYGINLREG